MLYLDSALKKHPEYYSVLCDVVESIENDEDAVLIDLNKDDDTYLKVNEVEKLLGLSRPTLNLLFDQGKLKGIRTPQNHRRFSKDSVVSYLKSVKDAESARNAFYKCSKDVEL